MNVVEIIINAIDETAKGFNTAITNVESLQKAASALTTVVLAEATVAAVALGALTEKAIDNGAAMGKLAQKAGAPIEEFSKIADAANILGNSNETLVTSYKHLDKSIEEALTDIHSKSALAFKAMGIELTDASGKAKTNTQIWLEIADKFSGFADGANKTALAVALLGRSGEEMIPMLNKGRDALTDLMRESSGTTEKFSREALEYEENSKKLQKQISAIGKIIATELLPYLVEFSHWILETSKESGAFAAVAMTVIDILKGFAIAVAIVYETFNVLGKTIGLIGFAIYEFAKGAVETFITAGKILGETLYAIVQGIIDLGKTATEIGKILEDFFSGNFKKAWEEGKVTVAEMKKTIVKVGTDVADSWEKNGQKIGNEWVHTWEGMKAASQSYGKDIISEMNKLDSFAFGLFTPKITPQVEPAKAKSNAPTYGEGDIKARENALRELARLEGEMNAEMIIGANHAEAEIVKSYNERKTKIEELAKEGKLTEEEVNQANLLNYRSYSSRVEQISIEHYQKIAELENKFKADTLKGYNAQLFAAQRTYEKEIEEIKKVARTQEEMNKLRLLADQSYASKRKTIEQSISESTWELAGQMLGAIQHFTKEGTALYKIFGVGQVIINTSIAVMKALAEVPWPMDVVQAAMYSAMGAMQIATIAGVSHAGLDYVPREGTYLLDEGEGVLTKQENAARLQGKGMYDGQSMELNIHIDGERIGRSLFKLAKSGRLRLQVA